MTQQARLDGVNRAISVARSRASLVALGALTAQILLLFVYLVITETAVTNTARVLLPFVWTTAAVWLVVHLASHASRDAGEIPANRRMLALVVALGYLVALSALGGLIGLTDGATRLHIVPATPGWGPVVMASFPPLTLVAVPYELVGYLGLSYGIYRALMATSRGAFAGLIGLFSCVGCTLPLIGALVSAAGGTAIAIQSGGLTTYLSTVVFVGTVGILAWTVPTETRLGR